MFVIQVPRVQYHGSITEAHGPALLIGPCECGPCKSAGAFTYELLSEVTGRTLIHTRPQSFTEES